MLIFGIRTKSKPVGHVLYHCSHCQANRVHSALSISIYFTLFFIPIRQMDLTGALPERV